MKASQFFTEALRAQDVRDRPQDTPEKKRMREPGDVGIVDRLTQMDKDKTNKKDLRQRGNYIRRTIDPVDRMLAQTKPDEKIDPRSDPDSPQYVRSTRSGKEIQQGMTQGFKPGMDAVSSADDRMKDQVRASQAPTSRERIKVNGASNVGDVFDSAYLRHGYQSSGVGLNKDLNQDDLDYLFYATSDPEPVKKDKEAGLIDKRGIEQTRQVKPTARDLEAHSAEAERLGKEKYDRAYLTPEVMKTQKALRKALDGQDSAGVQKIAFQHKVSDKTLQNYIDMHDYNRAVKGRKSSKLLNKVGEGGLGGGRDKAAYGGDLGEAGEAFKNEDGTYNLVAMKKKNRDLYQQAIENRGREVVRTYLRQGGRDAYASHEGVRSIGDMDLEHIRSLTAGGLDDPSNWVFASGELNKLRGNRDLTQAVEPFAEGPKTTDFSERGKTWDAFTKGNEDLAKRLEKELGGKVSGKRGTGVFSASGYKNLSDEELDDLRKKAGQLGMDEDQVNSLFPPRDVADPNQPYKVGGTLGDEGARIKGMPYAYDREQYDTDVTTDARDQIMYNKLMQELKGKYGKGMKFSELEQTPEGKEGMRQIRKMVRSGEMDQTGDLLDLDAVEEF